MFRKSYSTVQQAYAALLLVAFIWGLHGVVGKSLEARMDPLSLSIWRYTLTTICYVLLWGKSFLKLLHYDVRTLLQLAVAGILIVAVYPLFFYHSLAYLTPIESLVIMNTSPLLAALIALLFAREGITLWGWVGIFVSFGGIMLLIGGEPGGSGSLGGFALCAVGALSFAGYTVWSRQLMRTVELTEMLSGTALFGTAALWVYAAAIGEAGHAAAPLYSLSGAGWLELSFVVIFVSVIGYALNAFGMQRLPGGIAAAVSLYPQPAFAALFQWIWLGLTPSVWSMLSALLVFGGVALSRYQGSPKRRQAQTQEES
jgi:drug/metabolite transporter (DMT)-like permease